MPTHRIRARPPHAGSHQPVGLMTATDRVAEFLEDAAHYPGGHATGVVFPRNEAQLARALQEAVAVLPGRRAVVADRRRDAEGRGRAEPVTAHRHYRSRPDPRHRPTRCHTDEPPGHADRRRTGVSAVPTFEGATLGGVVSTNAAGATTFKYGTTRDWVRRLTVMLACGELLELERGQVRASTAASRSRPPTARSPYPCRPIGCLMYRSVPDTTQPRTWI